jgi:hypothetical protein
VADVAPVHARRELETWVSQTREAAPPAMLLRQIPGPKVLWPSSFLSCLCECLPSSTMNTVS